MDWETLAGQVVGSAAQLGLQFGNAYGQSWLATNQLEAQLELRQKYAPPMLPGLSPVTLFLMVGALILIAKR